MSIQKLDDLELALEYLSEAENVFHKYGLKDADMHELAQYTSTVSQITDNYHAELSADLPIVERK